MKGTIAKNRHFVHATGASDWTAHFAGRSRTSNPALLVALRDAVQREPTRSVPVLATASAQGNVIRAARRLRQLQHDANRVAILPPPCQVTVYVGN